MPAIVLPNGGPGARDDWGFDWLSQFYAARGCAVLQPMRPKIQTPVLLFHGDRDVVSVAESRVMADRLKNAGKQVTFVEYKGLDLYLLDATARTELLLSKSDAFLRASMGCSAARAIIVACLAPRRAKCDFRGMRHVTIHLSDAQEALLSQRLAHGDYATLDELVAALLEGELIRWSKARSTMLTGKFDAN